MKGFQQFVGGFVAVLLAMSIAGGPARADEWDDLNKQSTALRDAGKYQEAMVPAKRMLEIAEQGTNQLRVATSLNTLAGLYRTQGDYTEAEPLYNRALAIREKQLGSDHPDVAQSLNNLAVLYKDKGKYAEAESLYKRALAIDEKQLGPGHPSVATSLKNLAVLYTEQGKYAEAEPLYKRALVVYEKQLGSDHSNVARTLNNMGMLYCYQGKYAEAEPLFKRALAIWEKHLASGHPEVAYSLNDLAALYVDQGKYAEAEPLHKRALAIREKHLGPNHPDVATSLDNLALLYQTQGKYAEAEPLHNRALAIREKQLGPDHPDVANSLNSLAALYRTQGKYAEAEPLHNRALAIREKQLGPDHPDVANSLNQLALLYHVQGKYAEAESFYKRALTIRERQLGSDHSDVAQILHNLACLMRDQKKPQGAQALTDRAIQILKSSTANPDLRFKCNVFRATLFWEAGRRDEAVAELASALASAEFLRTHAAGAEKERAEFFGGFAYAFERMVAWQRELGHVDQALAASERSRARTLVDQLNAQGIDLLASLPAVEANTLRKRQTDNTAKIKTLEKQLELLPQRKDLPAAEKDRQLAQLDKQLVASREESIAIYRDVRQTSPAYRLAVGKDFQPIGLEQVQAWAKRNKTLLLQYVLGEKNSYLFTIDGLRETQLDELTVPDAVVEKLGVKPGPLTVKQMQAILKQGDADLVQLLADPKRGSEASAKLASLWQLLIPEVDRKALLNGQYARLVVIPDGPLTQLPFECLVVEPGEKPQYLLDVGPPIQYAPSATVLLDLSDRPVSQINSDLKPVLAVGNPTYPQITAPAANDLFAIAAPRSRYSALRGALAPLPHTATEVAWLFDVFGKQGVAVGRLVAEQATETNVRYNVAGRKIVHLACHGFVDQSYGNFFGALALTPGPKGNADSSDDGFLTLPEIYELNLKGCELAILSACETNRGPQQKGEGVWALSRGFLVAGSRRVVASNWLVDDEAAASLVSYYASIIAKQQKESGQPDYAAALQEAKRWVRNQDKWSAPYYWAPFVHIGPN